MPLNFSLARILLLCNNLSKGQKSIELLSVKKFLHLKKKFPLFANEISANEVSEKSYLHK